MADGFNLGSAYANIVLSTDGMKEGIAQAKQEMKSLGESIKDSFQNIGSQLTSIGGVMTGVAAPIAGFFAASIAEASEWQDTVAQTEAVLKSTGGAAGQTADELINFATSMQQVTRFSDDQILSGENLLLTFTNIGGKVFPRATTAMLNMSQAMKQDLKSSAIQLGKALNDPVNGLSALTRVGVMFTDEQKAMVEAMVEAGDVAGAQALILAELEREFGGSAIAAGQTFAGQLDIARRSVEDLMQGIGEQLIPIILDLVKEIKPIIQNVTEWVAANPELIKGIALIAGGLAILGPILIAAGLAIGAIGTIIGVILSPIGLVIGAIVGLYLAFQNNFLGIRDFLMPIITEIQRLIGALQAGVDPIDAIATAIGNLLGAGAESVFVKVANGIRDFVSSIGEFVTNNPEFLFALGAVGGAVGVVTGLLTLLSSAGTIAAGAAGILSGALGVLLSPIVLVTGAIAALLFAVQELYPGGIAGVLRDAATAAQQLAAIFMFGLTAAVNWIKARLTELQTTIDNVIKSIDDFIGRIGAGTGGISGIAGLLGSGQIGIQDILNAIAAQVQGRAGGGDITANMPYIVGERGPELFIPSSSGSIMPNGQVGSVYNITVAVPLDVLRNEPQLQQNASVFAQSFKARLEAQG